MNGPADQLAARRASLPPEKRALLERRLRGEAPAGERQTIPSRADDGPAPLSFAQQRLWFLDQLAPGNPFYNLTAAVRLRAPIAHRVLEAALSEVVRRHASLRTTFPAPGGEPQQVIGPPARVEIPVVDLRGTADREREAARQAAAAGRLSFDLARGPLLRAHLLRLGEGDWVLLLSVHHIVADGWSMGILFSELMALYSAAAAGAPSPLPEPRLQYADFAVWQRDWLSGERLETQLAYWKAQLDGVERLELPTDRPRPALQTFNGAICVGWPATSTQRCS
jgi:hypothetical protein